MNKKERTLEFLPKHAFWDTDINSLSIEHDKEFIIPRVLMTVDKDNFDLNIQLLERLYDPDEIYTALKRTKERISNDVCRMIAERYNEPFFFRYMID